MLTIYLAIILPFAAALFILLFLRNFQRFHLGWLVLLLPTSLFFTLLSFSKKIQSGQTFSFTLNWIPSHNLAFITYIDGLSMLFALLITGIGMLVVLYSIYYLSREESLTHFYIYLLLFMGSMLGIVFSDHLLGLYLFWEFTSISSFLLIAFWYQRKGSRYGAKKALLITVFGGFAMLASFLMLYIVTGTFSIQEIITMASTVKNHPLFTAIVLLLLLGAFTKSVQFPFHIWLPDAMEAPTPISAYLHSATMVKAGIYIVARFTPLFGGEAIWFWLVTTVGLITLFWAAFIAIRQTDLKALLAYSTVSQLGLIMSLFGISSLSLHPSISTESVLFSQAAFAALFHLINHSTFKGALFMIIGVLDFQLGTRDLRRLGGLISFMPISFTILLIGSFSMAGLPPFNGFLSKEMFFSAMLSLASFDFYSIQSVAVLFPAVAWIASIFTFIYSMILVFQTFLGKTSEHTVKEAREPAVGMLLAPTILATLVVLIFFFPNVIANAMIKPAIGSIYPTLNWQQIAPVTLWNGFTKEVFLTIGIIIIGVIGYRTRSYVKKVFAFLPPSLSFDTTYHLFLDSTEVIAKKITSSYMTGFLRHYFIYIFAFFVILVGGSFYSLRAWSFSLANDISFNGFDLLLAGTIVVSGITILFATSRLTAILVNGYIGFAIAMFFVIFRAPDLALTQLVVETVTTALFLLCFYFLPEWQSKRIKRRVHIPNLLLSIGVGVTFTVVALSVHNGRLFSSIATFYEQAYVLTGGKNIVNTILADFRAFDTMLEVIVLFIAGIGVYTLVKYTTNKGAKKFED